jgi:hypothetical protein
LDIAKAVELVADWFQRGQGDPDLRRPRSSTVSTC